MHLWIDNTGLHGAGKCLLGEARTDYEIKGLLQLATLIVFADTIEVGDFEAPVVAATSADFRDMLLNIGLEEGALLIHPKSREDYALACRGAADFAGEELVHRFRADEQVILGLPEPNIPRGAQFRPERTEWIVHLTDASELAKVNECALNTRAMGAVDYMLSGSARLRHALLQLISEEPDWSSGHTFQVESMLRAYLNDHLAQQVDATYAPAPHRADVITRQNHWVLEQLSNALDPIVNELRPEPLGIASVFEALIRRAKGEPRGIIGEALNMRERAAPLRPLLSKLQHAGIGGEPSSLHEIKQKIADVARGVRIDLGLESPWDALKIETPLGLPKPSMPLNALIDWARFRASMGRRAVLTDVVQSAAHLGVDSAIYDKLVSRCCSRDATT